MSDRTYRLANGLGRLALRALAVDTRWTGVEHLPTGGPVLLAANHVSFPDFVFVERAAVTRGRYVRFMTRHDVWDVPVVGAAMDRMQHVPVDRRAPAAAYLRARRLLRDGEAVCAFPEAGISWSYTVRPLMRGVASLSRETGVPVVPVAVWGSQRIFTVGVPDEAGRHPGPDLSRGRPVDLAFGEPLAPPTGGLDDWTRELGVRLTEMLEELQRLPRHRPRPGEWAPWHPAHLGGHAMTRTEAHEWDDYPRSAVPLGWGPLD